MPTWGPFSCIGVSAIILAATTFRIEVPLRPLLMLVARVGRDLCSKHVANASRHGQGQDTLPKRNLRSGESQQERLGNVWEWNNYDENNTKRNFSPKSQECSILTTEEQFAGKKGAVQKVDENNRLRYTPRCYQEYFTLGVSQSHRRICTCMPYLGPLAVGRL